MALTILSTSWQNTQQIRDSLDRLIAMGTDPQVIRDALRPGAELIAARWRAKVPSPGPQHPYSTGEYQRGIEVGNSEFDEDGFLGLDVFTEVVNSEDGFNYPEALEMGTDRMPAIPSALPAFDESSEEAIGLAVEYLNMLIEERASL
jgi:hypothetical protein